MKISTNNTGCTYRLPDQQINIKYRDIYVWAVGQGLEHHYQVKYQLPEMFPQFEKPYSKPA